MLLGSVGPTIAMPCERAALVSVNRPTRATSAARGRAIDDTNSAVQPNAIHIIRNWRHARCFPRHIYDEQYFLPSAHRKQQARDVGPSVERRLMRPSGYPMMSHQPPTAQPAVQITFTCTSRPYHILADSALEQPNSDTSPARCSSRELNRCISALRLVNAGRRQSFERIADLSPPASIRREAR